MNQQQDQSSGSTSLLPFVEDNQRQDGHEQIELTGILAGHHVIIDTEKMTRNWARQLEQGEDALYQALGQILVDTDLKYKLDADSLVNQWPVKKLNVLMTAVFDYVSGPKEQIS